MTNEEEIEEILIEAHAYGLREEVLDTAKKIQDENPRINRVVAYQLAFEEWIK